MSIKIILLVITTLTLLSCKNDKEDEKKLQQLTLQKTKTLHLKIR
jgi:hypothetical protein